MGFGSSAQYTGHRENARHIGAFCALLDSREKVPPDRNWRRGRDSNPRYSCPYAAFRVRCFQPLSHLSNRAEIERGRLIAWSRRPSSGRKNLKRERRGDSTGAESVGWTSGPISYCGSPKQHSTGAYVFRSVAHRRSFYLSSLAFWPLRKWVYRPLAGKTLFPRKPPT